MCQVNAENMISQIGYLDVKVPPILIEDRTSSDTIVDEHQKAILKCHAKGYPKPKITWRREFGEPINLGQFGGQKFSVPTFEGSQLNLTQVTRDDMGAYLCIASNGIPPSLSRRILLHVNFRPKIRVQNQLISSRIGSSVELVCFCEAHPKPIITWTLPNGVPIVSGYDSTSMMIIVSSTSSPFSDKQQSNNSMINKDQDVNDDKHNYSGEKNRRSMDRKRKKYETKEEFDGFRVTMILVINKLEREDFGSFKCSAKNLLGEKEGLIRVFENLTKSDISLENFRNKNEKKTKEEKIVQKNRLDRKREKFQFKSNFSQNKTESFTVKNIGQSEHHHHHDHQQHHQDDDDPEDDDDDESVDLDDDLSIFAWNTKSRSSQFSRTNRNFALSSLFWSSYEFLIFRVTFLIFSSIISSSLVGWKFQLRS
ncbi:Protein amalgam [Sarcoptes scabiei]|uniref:Protein amalgam n=1 Tax=Sarcoptes scabiei TaxID=52283 RepID=A0A834RFL7_SARSC|nr:Protein amalgam [Sarcoptes scabiei]